MGGKNPLVVLKDADIEKAVTIAIKGAFMSTGQKCTATSRVIVEEGIYEVFKDRLCAHGSSYSGEPVRTGYIYGAMCFRGSAAICFIDD